MIAVEYKVVVSWPNHDYAIGNVTSDIKRAFGVSPLNGVTLHHISPTESVVWPKREDFEADKEPEDLIDYIDEFSPMMGM